MIKQTYVYTHSIHTILTHLKSDICRMRLVENLINLYVLILYCVTEYGTIYVMCACACKEKGADKIKKIYLARKISKV